MKIINTILTWYAIGVIQRIAAAACAVAGISLVVGCASSNRSSTREPMPTEATLRITQQVGGTHYRTIVLEDAWLQTFGNELLVLEPRSARQIYSVHLGRTGETGAAIDMAVHDERLYVVLDSDAVVELNISDPRRPRTLRTHTAEELRIRPKRLSVVDDELYVSGIGGVVRWSDGERLFPNPGDVSRVVKSEEGLVACVGRRIYRLEDNLFVGSASDLLSAAELGVTLSGVDASDLLLFTRQSPQGALVGLMGPNLRELHSRDLTVAVPGIVRSVRIFDERIWIVTDTEIMAFAVEGGSLAQRLHVDILGARDLAWLNENHLAVAGSFGRCIYRINRTDRGPGDTFLQVHREPSRLSRAKWDGRHILAGSDEGSWLYLIGSRVELSNDSLEGGDRSLEPTRAATAVEARARIGEDGLTLAITTDEGIYEYTEPNGARLHCVIAVEGEFWLGHDRGITILHPRPPIVDPKTGERSGDRVASTLRLDGPVRYLFPLRVGRGAAFVSEFGGFGVVQWVEEPVEVRAGR